MAAKNRHLTESFAGTAPLRVDPVKGIIHGVRILGAESANTYGMPGVEATEYTRQAHADGRRLYEGVTVNLNHLRDPKAKRTVEDVFGKLRNCTTVEENGQPVTVGDLHYLASHPLAPRVCEDVEKGLGVYGLSHDALGGKERVDRGRKRLLIEGLTAVKSVDLVYKPATNRNLWESSEDPPVKKTLRVLLEALAVPTYAKSIAKSPNKLAWLRRLTEDGDMTGAMGAEVADPPADADEALAAGVEAAVLAIVKDDTMDAAAKAKKITKLLKAHEKLIADGEPEAPTDEEPAVDSKAKTESLDEVAALRRKIEGFELEGTVRRLCEAEGFAPSGHQLKALTSLSTEGDRKALIGDLKKAKPSGHTGPRSGFAGRPLTESVGDAPKTGKELAAKLKTAR